jgi:hypothetical protein
MGNFTFTTILQFLLDWTNSVETHFFQAAVCTLHKQELSFSVWRYPAIGKWRPSLIVYL